MIVWVAGGTPWSQGITLMSTWLGIASAGDHGTCALPPSQVLSDARISTKGALWLAQLDERLPSTREQRIVRVFAPSFRNELRPLRPLSAPFPGDAGSSPALFGALATR
jgi:hypothetical protein